MKIEEGKFYRTRDGRKVGPVRKNINGWIVGPWGFVDWLGATDGSFVGGRVSYVEDHEFDLIAEWVDEQVFATRDDMVQHFGGEPDTPKTWGEMTGAEKGALLLAEYEGGFMTLQYRLDRHDTWTFKPMHDGFNDGFQYRIKPETKTVVLGVGYCGSEWAIFKGIEDATYSITFTTTDGKPATGEFRNANGDSIKMEELK